MSDSLALDIQRWLASQHVRTSLDWLQACLEFLREEFELTSWNAWDVGRWRREVRQQWLFADLRELETGGLPEEVCDQPKAVLRTTACVQLLFAVDVSQPLYAQIRKQEGSTNENALVGAEPEEGREGASSGPKAPTGNRALLLHFTDGVRQVRGLEQRPCPALTPENLQPGAKFLLRGPITARRGVLLLGPDSLRPLGGQVDALVEENTSIEVLRSSLKKATGVEHQPKQEEPRRVRERETNGREEPRRVRERETNGREEPRRARERETRGREEQRVSERGDERRYPPAQARENPRAAPKEEVLLKRKEDPRKLKKEEEELAREWEQGWDDWEPPPEPELKLEPASGRQSPPRKKNRMEVVEEIFGNSAGDFSLDDDVDWMQAAAQMEAEAKELVAEEKSDSEPGEQEEPFSYIADIYNDVQAVAFESRRRYTVKGFLLTLLGRLEFHGGDKWTLDVRLTDGSANVDCEMADELLASDLLVGRTAQHCAALREAARGGNESAKEELVESLKEVQARLAQLNGLFVIEVDTDWQKPQIVAYREVEARDVHALQTRLVVRRRRF